MMQNKPKGAPKRDAVDGLIGKIFSDLINEENAEDNQKVLGPISALHGDVSPKNK